MSKSEIIGRYLRGQSLVWLFIQALALTTAGSRLKEQRDFIRDRLALLERSRELEREIIDISEREEQRIAKGRPSDHPAPASSQGPIYSSARYA
jgi:hypothetical protein